MAILNKIIALALIALIIFLVLPGKTTENVTDKVGLLKINKFKNWTRQKFSYIFQFGKDIFHKTTNFAKNKYLQAIHKVEAVKNTLEARYNAFHDLVNAWERLWGEDG